ncbi:MAG: hypothetical protein ACJ8H8_21050, partial [Geminicoccaceae bacterium]
LAILIAGCASTPPPAASTAADLPDAVVQYALETAPSGELVNWRTDGTGVQGTLTPLRTFRSAGGFCREFAVTLTCPQGQGRAWQETACRDASGLWRERPAVDVEV